MITCLHDFCSAASAVAVLRLQALADEGFPVRFEGFETLPAASALPVTLDVLHEVDTWRDRAAALGLAVATPRCRPVTGPAHVVAEVAEEQGLGASWRLMCYRAYLVDGADLGRPEVLRELALSAGLPADPVDAALADPLRLRRFRTRVQQRRGMGVGGVPVLDVCGALVTADLPDGDLRELASL